MVLLRDCYLTRVAVCAVRLDGHNFGPFTKVVVQPQLHPITKDPMIFPVQTFLPMDV